MRSITRPLIALASASALALGAVAATTSSSSAAPSTAAALALSDSGMFLRSFSLTNPSSDTLLGRIDGLNAASPGATADTRFVGIDFRIQDRNYYGVGDQGGIYTITSKGNAVRVSQLTVALSSEPQARFGVDFNPAADRLRIISSTGQNLRHNVNPGGTTINDTKLTYPATPPETGTVDALGVVGAAYTNNDLDASTATTLFDLDAAADRIALQSPANAGTLAPTGSLGVAFSDLAGFDIRTTTSGTRAVSNTAYGALRTTNAGVPSLYKIDLLSGKATVVAAFDKQVADIAIKQP
ncbi:DUF4394 domain-containing protein [Aeromicrobium sp.]|uniref:DUF4394 domain-containing protein n=1 Tax=Aeromicrobium sp. TaxID=1871063 RepID=UPI0030C1D80A